VTPARTLHDDIELLGGLLGEVIRAQERAEAFALEERARALGKALRSGEETAREQLGALVEGLSLEEATVLVRAMPRTRPPFPPEFRREAVKLMRESDKPLPQLAKDLGVSEQTLRDWRRQARVDRGRLEGLTGEQLDELRRLRRENRTLQMEREVLKKAAAFFARESEGR
jgi:transposase